MYGEQYRRRQSPVKYSRAEQSRAGRSTVDWNGVNKHNLTISSHLLLFPILNLDRFFFFMLIFCAVLHICQCLKATEDYSGTQKQRKKNRTEQGKNRTGRQTDTHTDRQKKIGGKRIKKDDKKSNIVEYSRVKGCRVQRCIVLNSKAVLTFGNVSV